MSKGIELTELETHRVCKDSCGELHDIFIIVCCIQTSINYEPVSADIIVIFICLVKIKNYLFFIAHMHNLNVNNNESLFSYHKYV